MSKSLIPYFKNKFNLSIFLLTAVYLVGFTTVLLGYQDQLMLLTPFNLLFASGLILWNAAQLNKKYLLWFFTIGIAGFVIEWIGTETGWIFGTYQYGETLGIKLLKVPLIIGLNWAVLVFSTAAFVAGLNIPSWLKSVIAATFMVMYDILLEPVAVRFDFWTWEGGLIPVQNYVAWWIISFLFLIPTQLLFKDLKNRLALPVIFVQALFFIVLIVKEGLDLF
jgi:bisanhydrobacterioruberin hydratase